MRVLATLERRTKEAAAPALERAGVSTEPDPEMEAMAAALMPGALAHDLERPDGHHRAHHRRSTSPSTSGSAS